MGKIDEWLDAMLDGFFSKNRKIADAQDTKKQIIDAINAKATLEQVQTYFAALSPGLKADHDVLRAYNSRLTDPALIEAAQKSTIEKLIDTAGAPFEALGKTLAESYMKIGAATPETALERAIEIVGFDFAKDVGIGLGGLTAEILSAGQVDTTADFFKSFKSKLGYGGIMTMLIKSPIELGVINPLAKALHAQYRDAYLGGRAALVLATKGRITEDQMRKAFSYEGYPEWQIDAIVNDRWRELRLGEIAWAHNDALADEKWLDEKLRNAMYSPEDRPVIIRMIQEKYLRTYRDRVASQIRNLYKEGYIDKPTFDSRLASLKIPPAVIRFLASEADYLYRLDLNADLIATWSTAYKNDIISEDELRGNLASIIVDPARVEAQVRKAVASRKPKAVAKPKVVTQGIRISTKPANAPIFLDGSDTGLLTPETLETTVGVHALTISAAGFEDAAYEVEIEAGLFVEIYAVLVPLPEAAE